MISTYQSRKARAQRRKFRSRLMRMERLEDRMVLTGASPVAVNDAYLAVLDTPLTITSPGVLANDTDAESDALTASIFSGPNHGSVTLSSDGSFTYTPAAGYTGLDSFLYQANDGTSSSKLAAVTIRVRSTGNQAPVASPDSYTVSEDGILDVGGSNGVLANDTDPDGNPLTSVLVTSSGPSHGTLTLNPNGSFNYVPDPDFNGTDSFSYQASDGSLFSDPAEVTITVTAQGDAPVAANDEYSMDEDETLVVAAPGVLENDFDADEDPLSAVIVSSPQHGTLTLDDDGNFVYTPDADFNGVDGFSYVASDGTSESDVAAVMITVNSIDDDPVAENDEFTTAEDVLLTIPAPGVLGNDTDPEGDTLSIFDFTAPVNGTLTLNPDGSLTYLPNADYFGPDAFAYRTTDGTNVSNFAAVTIEVTEVNDAPVANPDTATVVEDSVGNTIDVLSNDTAGSNESGQTLTVTSATAEHGTVVINSDGTLSYTPDADYFGDDTITYTITDDGTTDGAADPLTATSSVSVTVTEINDAPVANPDSATVAEDSVDNIIDVLSNDTAGPNEDAQTLTVTSATAEHGTVVINSDGTLNYTPDADYAGSDTITYVITDDGTTNGAADPLTATSTVSITATEINDAPVANPDTATVAEDSADNVIDVLSNDTAGSNESGQTLTVTSATAEHGTVVINSDGTLNYTPDADFFGSDTITYVITDDGTTDGAADPLTATGSVSVTVTEVNDAPVANPDSATVAEDSVDNVIDVLGNDTAGPGEDAQTLTVTSATAEHGTVVINSDGTLNYTPGADYSGSDTITYVITDDGTTNGADDPLTATGTVSITATEINDAPVANPDTATVVEDSADNVIDVLSNDTAGSNEGGQILTVDSATAEHGTVIINSDGTLNYTPDADFFGSDTITYVITDDGTTDGAADPLTATGSVSVTVTEVNDAPVANPDSATVAEDSVDNVIDVLGNDTAGPGEDAQTLTVTSATAEYGTVVINPDGTLSYTPDADYAGSDTITYVITDDGTTNGAADPLSATSTVSITATEINDAPVANPDTATVVEDSVDNTIDVLSNDSAGSNEGGQILTVDSATAEHGTVAINSDGTLSYTPDADYFGSDTITYTITDDGTTDGTADPLTATGSVSVTVTEINDSPVANPDSATVDEDSAANVIDVLSNDTAGPNEDAQSLTVDSATAEHGTVVINPDGTLSYTPDADYAGSDTITYVITDDGTTNGAADPLSATSTVSITVTNVNDAPVGVNDVYATDEDTPLSIPAPGVLGNDTDADGDALTVVDHTTPANGTLTVEEDGSFVYTPNPNFNGTDGFAYLVSDGTSSGDWTAVTIDVAPLNDAPTAVEDTYNTATNVTLNVASPGVLGNDSDVDGDVLSAVLVSGPSNGTLTLNPNGSFSYLANAGFIGADTFTYAASDGTLSTETTVTINVTGSNQKPVARNDSFTVDQDTVLNVPAPGVLGNDTDPNGDAITAVFFPSNPALPNRTAHGTITLNPDGSFIYTPDAGFEGDDFFLYQATDGHLKSSFAAVTIHVVPPTEALFSRFGSGGSGSDLIGDGLLDLLAGDQTGSKKKR